MENTIRNLHAASECFKNYSAGQLINMSDEELKTVCLNERVNLVESIVKLETKDLIRERIDIKRQKDSELVKKRKDFLNLQFGK